jgi:hypothetical protein
MNKLLESAGSRMIAEVQRIGGNIDPELLSWPGGYFIAVSVCLYTRVAGFTRDLIERRGRANSRACDETGGKDPGDVEEGVAAALAHDGPVLIDVVVNRTELEMPPSITAEMAKGFTLYMVKAILDGRGSDAVDLARTNLWR